MSDTTEEGRKPWEENRGRSGARYRWRPISNTERRRIAEAKRDQQPGVVQERWQAFLGRFDWEWFVTLTFRTQVHPEKAHKAFRWWVRTLERHSVGKAADGSPVRLYSNAERKHGGGIQWARALEFQKRGVIHYHALMRGTRDFRRLTAMDVWGREFGFAKVERIRCPEAVVRYAAKYIAKGGDLEVGGPGWIDSGRGSQRGNPLQEPKQSACAKRGVSFYDSPESAAPGAGDQEGTTLERWHGGVVSCSGAVSGSGSLLGETDTAARSCAD